MARKKTWLETTIDRICNWWFLFREKWNGQLKVWGKHICTIVRGIEQSDYPQKFSTKGILSLVPLKRRKLWKMIQIWKHYQIKQTPFIFSYSHVQIKLNNHSITSHFFFPSPLRQCYCPLHKKKRIYLGLCPKHRTPPTHRARLGQSPRKKRFFYNLWGLKASWNGQIWPPHCITCFRTFLDVCSKNNWMVIFTKKFGTLDPPLDPPTHSLGQSPK